MQENGTWLIASHLSTGLRFYFEKLIRKTKPKIDAERAMKLIRIFLNLWEIFHIWEIVTVMGFKVILGIFFKQSQF